MGNIIGVLFDMHKNSIYNESVKIEMEVFYN